jgi:predicted NAD/FAD-binding protein
MRIAIVGAGISGLTCAHMLHRDHELVVFEASDRAGGHANTVRVETDTGVYDLDTGFIVFNDRNYPKLERLLGELAVASQPSQMSFGVSDGLNFEYNGASANGLFASPRQALSPSFHRMVADLVRFNRDARRLLARDEDPSLRDWLAQRRYSDAFVERLIVPQASSVWSADPAQMWSFPARFLVEFFDNHGMLGFSGRPRWRTIVGGSRNYVEALTRPWRECLRLSTAVRKIFRHPGHVTVEARGGEPERFDAVVIATHSDQALALLGDPSDDERELLGTIPYQPNEAVLHTDRSLLPRRRAAWSSWNYHLLDEPDGTSTVTYHMNTLQRLTSRHELCVTLNRTAAIDPAKVIATIPYEHPVFTAEGWRAQERHSEISGVNRTHYCGAYWRWGFHEDGVVSAQRVAERLS